MTADYTQHHAGISRFVRFQRANRRCECRGECGTTHPGGGPKSAGQRCHLREDDVLPKVGTIHLSLLFLDGDSRNFAAENLRALCHCCFQGQAVRVTSQPLESHQ